MKITLSPVRSDATLSVEKSGEDLIVNGEVVQLPKLDAGESIDADEIECPWILGDVARDETGVLNVLIAVPYPAGAQGVLQVLDAPEDGPLV